MWWSDWESSWSDMLERRQINFKDERSVIQKAGSVRDGFLDTTSNEDRGGRWKQLTWPFSTIQYTASKWSITCNPWISWIYKISLCWNVLQNQWCYKRWIWKSNSIIAENIHYIVLIKILKSHFGKRHTEIGPVLEVNILCHIDVYGIEIQIPPHLEITPMFG